MLPIGDVVEAGPFEIERIHLTHSIPDSCGVALTTELGTVLFTGDYKFDQTPVGGAPADMARLAELGREGLLLLCGDSTNADRAGHLDSASRSSARTWSACSPAARAASSSPASPRTSTASSRSSHAAAKLDRKVALVGRSMRKNVNIGRSLGPHRHPGGDARAAARDRPVGRREDRRSSPPAPRASRCPRCAGWPTATTRRSSCKRGDTVVFSATPIPGNERAVNETIDRLYHIGCDVVTARDAPIHASGHGYAEEVKMMLNLTRPRYVMPVHGDFKRMLLHSQLAEAVGVPAENIFRTENGTPLEIDADGARLGEPERPAWSSSTASTSATSPTSRCATARMLSADGIFIIVATSPSRTARPSSPPEVLARGVPFLDGDGALRRRAARGGRGLA